MMTLGSLGLQRLRGLEQGFNSSRLWARLCYHLATRPQTDPTLASVSPSVTEGWVGLSDGRGADQREGSILCTAPRGVKQVG